MTNTIIPVLESRIPEYIRTSYPNFVQYIKDYLGWLEQDGNFLQIVNEWKLNNEPSLNIEPYVTAILNDLGFESGQGITVRKDLLIHLLRDFYLARGSEASFRLLFNILFGVPVDVRYPREDMLIPSYAEYGDRHFVFASALNRNTLQFETILNFVRENGGSLYGNTSKTLASIEDITIVYGQGTPFLQIEILEPLSEFIVGEQVVITGGAVISEEIMPALQIQITNPGSGYVKDDIINITGPKYLGQARVGATKKGGIDSVSILDGGTGYSVGQRIKASSLDDGFGFSAYITAVDGSGSITQIEVTSRGYNYETLPNLQFPQTNSTAVLQPVSSEIGAITKINIIDPYVDFDDASFEIVSDLGSGAILEPVQVSRWSFSDWADRRGFIAESSTLIDSDKYQQFSYTLVSPIAAAQYDSFVDDMLHPIGYVRNSSYEIVSEISLDPSAGDIDTSTQIQFIFEHNLGLALVSAMEVLKTDINTILTDTNEIIVTGDGDIILYTTS